MENFHIEKLVVDDTQIDFNTTVPVPNIMRIFNVCIFNHSNLMGLSHEEMQTKSNAFWVVTKIKLKIYDSLHVGDNIEIKTWTHTPKVVRFERDAKITKDGKTIVEQSSQWCCLDYTDFKPRKADSIIYPNLEMTETENLNMEFTNPREEFSESDYVYTRTVRASDIDVNFHTNNLKYNIFALDAFAVEELKNLNISEYEIYFVNQSHEGDKIKIYKKKIGDVYYIEGKTDSMTIFKAVIKEKTL